jgi:hypothetical protein
MQHEYKNQFHIDSVSMTDSGKYFVDFIFPHSDTIKQKISLQISFADYKRCKVAMDMQGQFPMKDIAKEIDGLVSVNK